MGRKERALQSEWDEEDIIYVSKSELKRDMQELRELGARLIELKPSLWQKLPLNERLMRALEESRRITSHNARKRHLSFIAKLMVDQDVKPIQELVSRLDASSDEYNRQFHLLERWRDRLLDESEGAKALTAYLSDYPQADHQYLRQLVRNAHKETAQGKPPASARKLFKYLREVDGL